GNLADRRRQDLVAERGESVVRGRVRALALERDADAGDRVRRVDVDVDRAGHLAARERLRLELCDRPLRDAGRRIGLDPDRGGVDAARERVLQLDDRRDGGDVLRQGLEPALRRVQVQRGERQREQECRGGGGGDRRAAKRGRQDRLPDATAGTAALQARDAASLDAVAELRAQRREDRQRPD